MPSTLPCPRHTLIPTAPPPTAAIERRYVRVLRGLSLLHLCAALNLVLTLALLWRLWRRR